MSFSVSSRSTGGVSISKRYVGGRRRRVLANAAVTARRRAREDVLSVGGRGRRARIEGRLSQEGLARLVGTSQAYVSSLERGLDRSPRLETIQRFAEALQIPLQDLTGSEQLDNATKQAIMDDDRLSIESRRLL